MCCFCFRVWPLQGTCSNLWRSCHHLCEWWWCKWEFISCRPAPSSSLSSFVLCSVLWLSWTLMATGTWLQSKCYHDNHKETLYLFLWLFCGSGTTLQDFPQSSSFQRQTRTERVWVACGTTWTSVSHCCLILCGDSGKCTLLTTYKPCTRLFSLSACARKKPGMRLIIYWLANLAYSSSVLSFFQYERGRSTADFVKFLNEKCGTKRLPGGALSPEVCAHRN